MVKRANSGGLQQKHELHLYHSSITSLYEMHVVFVCNAGLEKNYYKCVFESDNLLQLKGTISSRMSLQHKCL